MSAERPRVSIVIPVYNGSNFLREAIDSALAQTYPHCEVLVVDDGSNDGGRTAELARSYGQRIRLFHKPNGGVASALNFGIREMRGDWFSWLSHDDLYLPRKVEAQVEAMQRLGGDVLLYCDYEYVDARRRRLRRKRMRDVPQQAFRYQLLIDDSINGCTMLLPRAALGRESFSLQWPTTQDYELWFRLARTHRFVRVPQILVQSRVHGAQESWSTVHRRECDELHLHWLRELGVEELRSFTDEPLSLLYLRAAALMKLHGRAEAAREALALARRHRASWREALAPRPLAWRLAYGVADPRLRPLHWWRRIAFAGRRG